MTNASASIKCDLTKKVVTLDALEKWGVGSLALQFSCEYQIPSEYQNSAPKCSAYNMKVCEPYIRLRVMLAFMRGFLREYGTN